MCLVTKQREPKVLEKNLTVYKSVNISEVSKDTVISAYYPFNWTKGKLETTEMKARRTSWDSVEYFDVVVRNTYDHFGLFTEVSEGFHAYKTKRRSSASVHYVVKFLIPKGSLYYEDETGLIVANQMMLL